MRDLAYIPLLALAMAACNGDDSGDDTDSGDSDTEPTIVLSLEDGTTSYSVKVDGTAVCTSTYSMTGVEYTNGFCDNCDFMFSMADDQGGATTTETSNTDTAGCPNRDPWRYTLAVPYPAAYPDDRAGIGYVAGEWYSVGYDYIPITKMFFTFYHTDGNVYGQAILSGIYMEGTADEDTFSGTFTNTDGDIAWTYNPDPISSARAAFIRNCSDRTDPAEGNSLAGFQNGPPGPAAVEPDRYDEDTSVATDDLLDYVTTPTTTLSGSITCSPAEFADSFTVSVAAAGTLSLSVDVPSATNHFDPYIWVNDSNGCTIAAADDQFQCAATECDDPGDTAAGVDPSSYNCCPSLQLTNGGGSAATYTVYVTNTNVRACADAGHAGNYSIKMMGGTALTADGDNLHPSYELDASGTGTVVETEE